MLAESRTTPLALISSASHHIAGMAHLSPLIRLLMEMGPKHLFRDLLQTFLGSAAHKGHRRQPLNESGPFPFTMIHCIFADRLDKSDRLNRVDCLEEDHC